MSNGKNVMQVDGINRRQAIFGAVAAFSALGVLGPESLAHPAEEISHSAEAIHQENVFKASRKRVYEALTETKQFDKLVKLSGISDALGTKPTQISQRTGWGIYNFRWAHHWPATGVSAE